MNPERSEPIIQKKVDENWKAEVEQERHGFPPRGPAAASASSSAQGSPQADFSFFLSSLSMQAMIALGELPHPATNERQVELEQARTLIDVLGMLQAKTKGNLTAEEAAMLEGLLYELRMKYVSKSR